MDLAIRVKTIDQNTFDEVVEENIVEFDMSIEDAIEDAVKQFESQNVELSNIVKTLSLSDDGVPCHAVISAVQKIIQRYQNTVDENDYSVIKELDLLRNECEKGISYRILAAKHGAYRILLSCCQAEQSRDQSLFMKSLNSLVSLTKGQPDLLEESGQSLLLKLLENNAGDPEVVKQVLKLTCNFCLKHESNRQSFVNKGMVSLLMNVLKNNETSSNVIRNCCVILRVLTFDDDVRVPFGKAHDHAKHIVTDHNAISVLCSLISKFMSDAETVSEMMMALSRLAVRNEFCQEIMENDGVKQALNIIAYHHDNQEVVKNSLFMIKTTSGNDDVKNAIFKYGGIPIIINCIQSSIGHLPAVVEAGCATISMLAIRNTDNCTSVIEAGGVNVILQAMNVHADHKGIQIQCCMAIRNLISRIQQFASDFIEQGAEELIQQAKSKHEIDDVAKAALRDLGCKLELQELWKGERGDICK